MQNRVIAMIASLCLLSACGSGNKEVGEFKNDWLGNEIKIEALPDPDIPGIVCHLAHFDRGVWDRLGKGNWFEDPSNSSISCLRAGPVDLGNIRNARRAGAEIFSQSQSLVFKQMSVRRILDIENRAVLYISYSRKPVDGSAKMSLSTVALSEEDLLTYAGNR